MAASGAHPEPPVAPRPRRIVVAPRAPEAVRPATLREVGIAGFLGREPTLELDQRLGEARATGGHLPTLHVVPTGFNRIAPLEGNDFEVSIFAPGHQAVRGYDKDTGQIKNTNGGTSMAAPQVTATAALLRCLNKDLTAEQIKKIITTTAHTRDGTMILSVDEAVRSVIDTTRDLAGLPRLTREALLDGGVVDAVAVPIAGTPGTYTVRGICLLYTSDAADE